METLILDIGYDELYVKEQDGLVVIHRLDTQTGQPGRSTYLEDSTVKQLRDWLNMFLARKSSPLPLEISGPKRGDYLVGDRKPVTPAVEVPAVTEVGEATGTNAEQRLEAAGKPSAAGTAFSPNKGSKDIIALSLDKQLGLIHRVIERQESGQLFTLREACTYTRLRQDDLLTWMEDVNMPYNVGVGTLSGWAEEHWRGDWTLEWDPDADLPSQEWWIEREQSKDWEEVDIFVPAAKIGRFLDLVNSVRDISPMNVRGAARWLGIRQGEVLELLNHANARSYSTFLSKGKEVPHALIGDWTIDWRPEWGKPKFGLWFGR